jgi:uncharacterized protein
MKPRTKRKICRRLFGGAVALLLLLIGSWVYATKIEPNWVDIHYVPLTLPRLDPAFDGYKIAQITDVHADSWMTEARLHHIVSLINALQPDAVALTGDYVTHSADRYAPALTAAFQQFAPKDVTVAVLGNHDQWSSPEVIRRMLKQSQIEDISNGVVTIRRQNALLHLAGVDDVWTGHDRLDLVLEQLPEAGAAVLLAHEPDFADTSAATDRFDLQISGHSHGGQISFPVWGAPHLPRYAYNYPSGRYQVGTMIQYTNRGIGMVSPRVRFNCRPEIAVFVLQAAKPA